MLTIDHICNPPPPFHHICRLGQGGGRWLEWVGAEGGAERAISLERVATASPTLWGRRGRWGRLGRLPVNPLCRVLGPPFQRTWAPPLPPPPPPNCPSGTRRRNLNNRRRLPTNGAPSVIPVPTGENKTGPVTAKQGTLRVPHKCIQVGDRMHQEISRDGGGPSGGGGRGLGGHSAREVCVHPHQGGRAKGRQDAEKGTSSAAGIRLLQDA